MKRTIIKTMVVLGLFGLILYQGIWIINGLKTKANIYILQKHERGWVNSIVFLNDQYVTTGAMYDYKIFFEDIKNHWLATLPGNQLGVNALAKHPNGKFLFSVGFDDQVLVWNVDKIIAFQKNTITKNLRNVVTPSAVIRMECLTPNENHIFEIPLLDQKMFGIRMHQDSIVELRMIDSDWGWPIKEHFSTSPEFFIDTFSNAGDKNLGHHEGYVQVNFSVFDDARFLDPDGNATASGVFDEFLSLILSPDGTNKQTYYPFAALRGDILMVGGAVSGLSRFAFSDPDTQKIGSFFTDKRVTFAAVHDSLIALGFGDGNAEVRKLKR